MEYTSIKGLLELIQALRAQLAVTKDFEHQHNLSLSLLHLRQSLETEMLKVYDLIREVS